MIVSPKIWEGNTRTILVEFNTLEPERKLPTHLTCFVRSDVRLPKVGEPIAVKSVNNMLLADGEVTAVDKRANTYTCEVLWIK